MSRSSSVAAVPIPPGLSHAAMLLAHKPTSPKPQGADNARGLHTGAHKSHMQQDEVLLF